MPEHAASTSLEQSLHHLHISSEDQKAVYSGTCTGQNDTSVLLLLLKIGSHMNDLVCCQKLLTLDPSCYLIQFSIVQTSAPFLVDFAPVTCVRFVTHNLM